MRLTTERLELLHGPYDGARVTVLEGTQSLVLAFDPFPGQPFTDKRRALYRRRGDRLVFVGVALMKCGAGPAKLRDRDGGAI